MPKIIWSETQGFINRVERQAEIYFGDNGGRHYDFTDYFRVVAVAESGRIDGDGGNYDAHRDGSSFYGKYQVGKGVLTDLKFFEADGACLGVHNMDEFLENPIAQEIAAYREFSGVGTKFASRYHLLLNEFYNLCPRNDKSLFNEFMMGINTGKIYTATIKNGNGNEIRLVPVTFSIAGLSAAAHNIGARGLARVLKKVVAGEEVNGDVEGGDGNGVGFTGWLQVFKDYDYVSPLFNAWGNDPRVPLSSDLMKLLRGNDLLDEFLNEYGDGTCHFLNPDIVQTLKQKEASAEAATVGPSWSWIPIVLDMDGDGIETTNINDGAYFDHDANGFAERTGWASPHDGLLAWDRNGDGIINDGKELFNDPATFPQATNGFQVLAALDNNKDGKIDANDAVWSNLKVWQDYDGDGYSAADEFWGLSELGIACMSTGGWV